MSIKLVLFFLFWFCISLFADEINEKHANKLANAIKRIENSDKYPHGIKSIQIKGNNKKGREAYARKICLNTIRHSYLKYNKTNKGIDFVSFLAKTYAPIGVTNDPNSLNKNWIKNVKFYLKQN